jgi:hypothetical protein
MQKVTQCVAGLAFVAVCAGPAHAQQTRPSTRTAASGERAGEVGLTYSVMRIQETTAKAGFGVDVSRAIGHSANNVGIHVVGEVNFNHFYGETATAIAWNQTSFMGGLRLSGHTRSGATPFAQVLAGGAHATGETDGAVSFGGGVSVPFSGNTCSFRLQVDFPMIFYQAGVDETDVPYAAYHATGARINVGVAIPFGK